MKLSKVLVQQCFGADAKVNSLLFGGYKVKTFSGGSVILMEHEFKNLTGGNDVYEGVARIAKAMGWPKLMASGSVRHVASMMAAAKTVDLEVEAGGTKRFFGLVKDPPPVLPRPSGAHGSQGLGKTDADLRAAGLLGGKYGEGIRVGASLESGETLRYAGLDAENSLVGYGPPGSGKGVAFQINSLAEANASSVTIDPSGQLFATCAPELLRRGFRVIPIMPFKDGFPEEIGRLSMQSRCLNPMDALKPESDSFDGDCGQMAQLLKSEEKATGGDPFFPLAGRNLIKLLIASVKLYAHPSEQNLCEVYHKLGNIFDWARLVMAKPDLPRFIATPMRRWAASGAEMDRTLRSIVETAIAELSWLGDEAIERVLRTSSFEWRDLKNGPRPVAVFVLLPVNKLESHKALLTLCAGAALMGLGESERGRHRVLFTIDEAALLGYMPMLQRAFAESRKRGVQLSVWFQNIHQSASIYGPAWKNMLSGSDLQIFLRPRDLGTAQFICEQIGTTTEIVPHLSYGDRRTQENVSFSEHGRPVMFPQEAMALPKGTAVLIAPGRSKNVLLIWARPWFECPDLKGKLGNDPYHRHRTKK